MLNFHRAEQFLAMIAPSVPRALAQHVAATQIPMPVKPPAGMGHTPEGDASAPTTPTWPAVLSADCASPSGPPDVEMTVSEPLHPFFRARITDKHLADLMDRWTREAQA